MKKFLALLTPALYLSLASSAFAVGAGVQISNPCDSSTGGFSFLCNLQAASAGTIVGSLVQLLFVVAILAALIYLVYGGFRWLVSSGDKAQVAAAREHLVAAIIGLVIIFLSYFVLNLLLTFFGLGNLSSLKIPTLQ
jgi:hypothetical protein